MSASGKYFAPCHRLQHNEPKFQCQILQYKDIIQLNLSGTIHWWQSF